MRFCLVVSFMGLSWSHKLRNLTYCMWLSGEESRAALIAEELLVNSLRQISRKYMTMELLLSLPELL